MKRNNRHRLILPALLGAVLFLGSPQAPAQIVGRQSLCSSGKIPEGWVKVDVDSDPTACGAGVVWVIERHTNKAPGSAMVVCADQPTPEGWVDLTYFSSSGQCADGVADGNVKSIRRIGTD